MTKFSTSENQVIGLRLPNGTEVWPPNTWHGRPIDTPENRQVIIDALKMSSDNLGIGEATLRGHFSWLRRVDVTYTTVVPGQVQEWPLDDESFLPNPSHDFNIVQAAEATEESDGLQWVGAGPDPRHSAVDTGL